ncbi:MAG: hypothetical protein Aureis2KO_05930 [Aureisphaera sp.]
MFPLLKKLEKEYLSVPSSPDSLKAHNNYLLGLHFKQTEQLDSAAVYFQNATEFVNDSITKEIEGYYFQSAWDAYYNLGLSGDCFVVSQKFKSLLNPEKQFRSLSWAYYWDQYTYQMMGDHEKSLESIDERIRIAQEKDSASLTAARISKAWSIYYYSPNKQETFKIFEDLVSQSDGLSNSDKNVLYGDYGVLMYYAGDFEKSLNYYQKGLAVAKESEILDKTNRIANAYNNIAEVNIDLKRYADARKYLDSVKLLGIANLARDKQKSLLNYELRLAMESGESSSQITNLLNEINDHQDEVYRQKSENELLALTKANEKEKQLLLEKQATEIENLQLQNRSILLLISIGLLSIIGFLFYQSRRLKFEKQSLQNQQRLLRSQMNPHFTFNTLYAIQSQIKKAPEEAGKYLLKFSRLLRLFLENSMGDYIALEKEIESLKKYMDLQLLRAPKPFEYEFHYTHMEEDELLFIPPMLLQPFVENAIEHGFSDIDYHGKIDISLTLEGKFIACQIEDNGSGIRKGKNISKESASTQLISDFLKKSTKKDLEIIDKRTINPEKSGLLVRFLIPFKLTEHD